jgi:tRNA modification GTPase
MQLDTIAAISTPMGEGGIAIIRVSGHDAIHIVDKLYKGKKKLLTVKTHTIQYGYIIQPETNESLEEVMVTVMRAPKTFTKEDVVEVNCHGGLISVQRILSLILKQGARLAEPGEFTKRAFLNGRIDLSQAEAVIDLIRAKTDKAMNVAFQQVEGRLSRLIKHLRQELIETLAHIEVTIDYPEHDVEEYTHQFLLSKSEGVLRDINQILKTASQGKILREGLSTAIIGRPNVGKSSLLNTLVHEIKAIVTDIPGTTRDVIEEYVNVRGVPLKLLDTAGIRETDDVVERMGVEKSKKLINEADLVLLVLNYADQLNQEDMHLISLVKRGQSIIIINKVDLEQKINFDAVRELAHDIPVVSTSLLEEKGLNELEEAIAALYFEGEVEAGDMTYVSNVRHIHLLESAAKAISDAIFSIQNQVPIDMVQIDLQRCWELLGEIIGEAMHESLIDQLFSQFCLGK